MKPARVQSRPCVSQPASHTVLTPSFTNKGLGASARVSRTAVLRNTTTRPAGSSRCIITSLRPQSFPHLLQHGLQHNSSSSFSLQRPAEQRQAVRSAASKDRQPDRLLLQLLGGPETPKGKNNGVSNAIISHDTPTNSSSSSSSRDGTYSSLDQAGLGLPLRQGIINPNNKWYRAWWGLLIGAAAFTGIFVPWELGFGDMNDMYSLSSAATWVDIGLVALFMADIAVSHFVAYETDEMIIDDPGAIAVNYRRQRLALDVISAIPFDWIAYAIAVAVTTAAVARGHSPADAAAAAADTAATAGTAAAAVLATAATTAAGAVADTAAAVAAHGVGWVSTAHAAVGATAVAPQVTAMSAAAAAGRTAAMAAAGGGVWQDLSASSLGSLVPTIACLKGLHLVRLYRVRWFFRYLEYDLTVSLLTVTVARNLVIVLYLTHWVACGFNLLARSGGYDPDLLVGLNTDLFASISLPEQYLYSLYWSVTTLAGNEWSGMDAVTDMRQVVANTFRASVFLLFNIALGAYILGTITLLVVKSDERTGRYRDMSSNLKTYSLMNQLPAELKDEMQEHLRLKFNHQEASDDQVLSIYPTTIRRRILRHLYLRHLRSSYLFRGAPRKYLDSLLSASRLELFRPGVDLLAAGDAVNELFIVVAGRVELRSPLDTSVSQYDWGGDLDIADNVDPLSSMMGDIDQDMNVSGASGPGGLGVYVGPRRVLGPGELLGEISFFTEIPQMETVRSLSTVRVMVITRGAFESIERNFPIASRLVLENLKRRSEGQVAAEFPGLSASGSDLQHLLASCPSSLMYSWASPELVELMMDAGGQAPSPNTTTSSSSSSGGGMINTAAAILGGDGSSASLTARQELVLSNLVRVMAVINQHVAKQEEDRTTDFLYAATRGDTVKLRAMLQQGFNPDSADYDGRTALMLACVRGHRDVVSLLLAAGANPRLDDNLGRSALLEACYHGHDGIIETLKTAGASLAPTRLLDPSSSSSSSRLSTSGSSTSNISGVRSSSSSSSSGDQGKRGASTDLAAAGSFGSLSGGSGQGMDADDDSSRDPYATHQGASWALQLASLLCNCVYECNLPLLRRLLRAGVPVNIGDYDKRTALHISAAEGNAVMVRVLVEEGGAHVMVQDRWGNTPLDEARRVGAALVVSFLEQAAVKRREADLARRAEQQRLLSDTGAAPVSNWRREQQLQQQLRSQEISELYRLRQVQAQQVRQVSSSLLGESPARSPEPAKQKSKSVSASPVSPIPEPSSAPPLPSTSAAEAQGPPKSSSSSSNSRSSSKSKAGASPPAGDAVVELLQLAQQAQRALTLKVEEMELDLVETLQHKRELNEGQQGPQASLKKLPSNSSSSSSSSSAERKGPAGSSSSAKNGSSSGSTGRSRSNNVVSGPKLQQQPAGQPVRASVGGAGRGTQQQ